ncbi:MAG: poly(R)-hydroxyalkanoic acid synthase subunit PhaE [Myxococcota bacterium]
MVNGFDQWKKGFDQWEHATAKVFEEWMKSPLMLEPSGAMLSAVMKLKKASDAAMSAWWGAMGLPTKKDQERTLHELHRLQSKILDLEEKLEAARPTPAATATTAAAPTPSEE